MIHPRLGAVWPVLAMTGHAAAVTAFLWLPWATGSGALVGRDFSGPQLARLARNTDVLLPATTGGPTAFALAAALYAAPVAGVVALLVLVGAPWTSDPAGAARVAAGAGLLIAVVAGITSALLLAGPGAGENLSRLPAAGALITIAGGTLGCTAALRTARGPISSRPNP
jgi:hypothetical protein